MSEPIRTRQDHFQEPLFIESQEEAFEATAIRCGGKKEFACALRPDLADEPEKALRWFLDALNPDRRTELHVEHLKRGCKKAAEHGCHILKHWFDDATGYERTGIAPQKTEYEELAAELGRLASKASDTARRLGEIERQQAAAVELAKRLRAG